VRALYRLNGDVPLPPEDDQILALAAVSDRKIPVGTASIYNAH
jgi:hypothetical protein